MDLKHPTTEVAKEPSSHENGNGMIGIERIIRKDGFYITGDVPGTLAQTAGDYGMIFTATAPCEVLIVSEVHAVAATIGTVTLDVEKLTGTTAPGSGTSILAAQFSLTSTANTPVRKSGTGLSSARQLDAGNRIAIKTTGVLTTLQGVQVTLYIKHLGRGDYR